MEVLVIGPLEQKEIYNKIKEVYPDAKTPLDTAKFTGTNEERYERAFNHVEKADLIICEASNPSTGMGMELREAINLKKRIIVIAKEGSKVSGLIKGCPSIKSIIYYSDKEGLKESLSSYFPDFNNPNIYK